MISISDAHSAADWIRWFIVSIAGLGIGFCLLLIWNWFKASLKPNRKPESYQPRHVTFAAIGYIFVASGVMWAHIERLGEQFHYYGILTGLGLLFFIAAFHYIKKFVDAHGPRVVEVPADDGDELIDRVYTDNREGGESARGKSS